MGICLHEPKTKLLVRPYKRFPISSLLKTPSFILREPCMVFCCTFLRSYKELRWRDIECHLPLGGQTS